MRASSPNARPARKPRLSECELCGDRAPTLFIVVCEENIVVCEEKTAKAHACLECLEEFREVPGGTMESMSLQDYQETKGD
jgi:hypothetical protein